MSVGSSNWKSGARWEGEAATLCETGLHPFLPHCSVAGIRILPSHLYILNAKIKFKIYNLMVMVSYLFDLNYLMTLIGLQIGKYFAKMY